MTVDGLKEKKIYHFNEEIMPVNIHIGFEKSYTILLTWFNKFSYVK